MTNKKVIRKLERLIVKLKKYPQQVTREDKIFLAKVLAIKDYIKKQKEDKDEKTKD